jgi:hypothetical protein
MAKLRIAIVLLLLTSCEGFKVLTLTNASKEDIVVIVKPGTETIATKNNLCCIVQLLKDSMILQLPPDSSIVLSSTFTTMISGSKIKAHDIKLTYLAIQSKNDTIIANGTEQILNLLTDERTRYRSGFDKPMTNAKNFGNIIVR